MKLLAATEPEKLRGGYYTPASVVDECLDRLNQIRAIDSVGCLLEPSAGDGAFIEGLRRRMDAHSVRVTCIEVMEEEADECRRTLGDAQLAGDVQHASFFRWVEGAGWSDRFDAIVGNPPFVRYQFVDAEDRRSAQRTLRQRGIELAGVSNLWISFVLVSLHMLRHGGAFALVLPAELLSTVSAAQVRDFLVSEFENVQVDLYPRATFPDILQDVMVLSGVRRASNSLGTAVRFVEHRPSGKSTWSHHVAPDGQSWVRLLLDAEQLDALSAAARIDGIVRLREVARIQVAIVTGANSYFTVPSELIEEFEMEAWAVPLLARTEDSPGLIFRHEDHHRAKLSGKRTWLLDFGADRPDPSLFAGPSKYIVTGEEMLLNERYKCRIRNPWYRVPQIREGSLMMSKRAHQHHRLLLNEVGAFTTDTIYRGEMVPAHRGRATDLVAGFHNSLTLLSTEVEGRSYGGGVLELVPSEIARLHVPLVNAGACLSRLDDISRSSGGQKDTSDAVVEATDQVLSAELGEYSDLVELLAGARRRLRERRQAKRQ